MIHIILWLHILALFTFIASGPMLITAWLQGLYSWTKTAMAYLGLLVVYLLIFTITFFISAYIENLPVQVFYIMELIKTTASAGLLYLFIILVLKYLGKSPALHHKAGAALPGLLLLAAAVGILFFNLSLPIPLLNGSYYLYIAAVSLMVFIKSRGLAVTPEEGIIREFLLINLVFNIIFLIYVLTGGFLLPGNLPGILILIPLYIISWALVFIIRTRQYSPFKKQRKRGMHPAFLKNHGISPREKEVIEKLLDGRSNREISELLFISPRTVETHIYNIYQKCGVKSRLELVQLVSRY